MDPLTLFEAHRARLDGALHAIATRGAWSPFQESPAAALHAPGAKAAGIAAFEAHLGRPFELDQPGETGRTGVEVSPYTQEPLAIDYPRVDVDVLLAAMRAGMDPWVDAGPRARVGVCLEMLARLEAQVFENAYATMHTAGQSFLTAFAGSGANSLDRGLEALAYAHKAMADVPEAASFARSFGRGGPVHLQKRYRLVPRGVAVVISCGTYPAWNAYPALFANLATGNPVVIKPHPDTLLPMAIAVRTCRQVLRDAGFSPDLVTLAADTRDEPIARVLLAHPSVAIVDFTGGAGFGAWIEANVRARVFTETAGCNAVILESADDLDAVLEAIATGLCLFSGQMCTTPQNLYVPPTVNGVPRDEVVARLIAAVDALVASQGPGLCAALQSPAILADVQRAQDAGPVLRPSGPYVHPEFPHARTATPLILRGDDPARVQREHFGPISFVIPVASRNEALARATADARDHGSIASYAYSTDPTFLDAVEAGFWAAGASVGLNLVGQRPMNFTAAYSDYHVTGLNPAGNACLTDLAFVADRFRIVQSKREVSR